MFIGVGLDFDRLKEIKDTRGHLAGDRVIKEIARIAAAAIRDNDMLVRWGGDEFVILTLGKTEQAESIATRILEAVQTHDFSGDHARDGILQMSVSCGVAGYAAGDTLDTAMALLGLLIFSPKCYILK
jgi:diguanylate cyclase (GGDEF)-like protein